MLVNPFGIKAFTAAVTIFGTATAFRESIGLVYGKDYAGAEFSHL